MWLNQVFDILIYKKLVARKEVGDDNFIFNRADIFFKCPNCKLKLNIGIEPVIFLIMLCPNCRNCYQISNSKVNRFTGKVSIDMIQIRDLDSYPDVKRLYEKDSGVKVNYDKKQFGNTNAKLNKLGKLRQDGNESSPYK